MKSLLFIFLTLSSIQIAHAFRNSILTTSKNRHKICNPNFSLLSGIEKSIDFGRSYSICAGFTCLNGYLIDGSTCIHIPVITFNVVCQDTYPISINYFHGCSDSSKYGLSNTYSLVGGLFDGLRNSTPFNYKYNCPISVLNLPKTTSKTYPDTGWGSATITNSYPIYLTADSSDVINAGSLVETHGCSYIP